MSRLDDKTIDVKIKEVEYRIAFTHANSQFLIDNNVYGKCDLYNKIIYIDKDYDNYLETIRHELTHAFIFEYGFENIRWNEEQVAIFVSKYAPLIEEILKKIMEDEDDDK